MYEELSECKADHTTRDQHPRWRYIQLGAWPNTWQPLLTPYCKWVAPHSRLPSKARQCVSRARASDPNDGPCSLGRIDVSTAAVYPKTSPSTSGTTPVTQEGRCMAHAWWLLLLALVHCKTQPGRRDHALLITILIV